MLKPALRNRCRVDSCRLPFGRPTFRTYLLYGASRETVKLELYTRPILPRRRPPETRQGGSSQRFDAALYAGDLEDRSGNCGRPHL
jgi:hypothetical protein